MDGCLRSKGDESCVKERPLLQSEGFGQALRLATPGANRLASVALVNVGTDRRRYRNGGGLMPPPRAYERASNTILNGVAVARRMLRKPPALMTSRSFASPACAPNAAPTSCDRDVGTHTSVDAA